MPQLIIAAVGPDRPGIVGELTAHLHGSGANILDSRMINLRGEFAMLMLVEAPESAVGKLRDGLPGVGEKMGMQVTITPQQGRQGSVTGLPYRLKSYSMDQPGIVARITRALRDFGVNIEELSARQESAPFAGSLLFLTEMRLTVPASVRLGDLKSKLQSVAAELNCDIDLDPA